MDSGSGSKPTNMAASMEDVPQNVQRFLKEYPELKFHKDSQKIKCSLSGHEMPCKVEAIRNYVKGKKFRKLQNDREFDYDRFKPHIVPNTKKNHEHQLFCLLTLSHINKTPRHVQDHINGRKYKKELERWKKCQETGEKFRPLCARKRKREPDVVSEEGKSFLDSDVDSDATDDSFSDLYPPHHFGGEKEGDILDTDSSYEFEDMIPNPETEENNHAEGMSNSEAASSVKKKKKKKDKPKKLKN